MEAEEDPREMCQPVKTGLTSSKGILQLAVSSLHEAISLWVVGSRHCVLHAQLTAQRLPGR
jgi:hypothetical protein